MSTPVNKKRRPRAEAHVLAYAQHRLAGRTQWDGDCLLWTLAVNNEGAPVAKIEGLQQNVRRWLWTRTRGPIPDGCVVAPTCRDSRCLQHLECMTRAGLLALMVKHGELRTPARLLSSTLSGRSTATYTMDQAREARRLRTQGLKLREVAQATGLPVHRVSKICLGQAWVETAQNACAFTYRPAA